MTVEKDRYNEAYRLVKKYKMVESKIWAGQYTFNDVNEKKLRVIQLV